MRGSRIVSEENIKKLSVPYKKDICVFLQVPNDRLLRPFPKNSNKGNAVKESNYQRKQISSCSNFRKLANMLTERNSFCVRSLS